jgi:hypothetical protein
MILSSLHFVSRKPKNTTVTGGLFYRDIYHPPIYTLFCGTFSFVFMAAGVDLHFIYTIYTCAFSSPFSPRSVDTVDKCRCLIFYTRELHSKVLNPSVDSVDGGVYIKFFLGYSKVVNPVTNLATKPTSGQNWLSSGQNRAALKQKRSPQSPVPSGTGQSLVPDGTGQRPQRPRRENDKRKI